MRKDRPEDAIAVKGRPFTGAEYLESLRDGREVWICGERVADVTAHPAFRNAARTVAKLYDALHNPASKAELTVATRLDASMAYCTSRLCSTAHTRSCHARVTRFSRPAALRRGWQVWLGLARCSTRPG